jgi:hypothetical protein
MSNLRSAKGFSLSILLIVATVLAAGCGGAKNKQEETASGVASGDGTALSILPSGQAAEGWARSGEPRVFNADNLWEYINGGAE